MKRVNFHLTDDQMKWLRAESERTGLTVAELIRRALDDRIRRDERRRRLEAGESIRSVAEAFGIGPTVVGYIKSGRIWSYV